MIQRSHFSTTYIWRPYLCIYVIPQEIFGYLLWHYQALKILLLAIIYCVIICTHTMLKDIHSFLFFNSHTIPMRWSVCLRALPLITMPHWFSFPQTLFLGWHGDKYACVSRSPGEYREKGREHHNFKAFI